MSEEPAALAAEVAEISIAEANPPSLTCVSCPHTLLPHSNFSMFRNATPSAESAPQPNPTAAPGVPSDGPIAESIKPSTGAKEQVVTPWDVQGGVTEDGKQASLDYEKLIRDFGTKRIDDALLERFERLTGKKPHPLLRRGMFFSHR